MRKTITIVSAVGLCVACAPWATHHASQPAAVSAQSCAKTAELLDQREGLLDDMHLSPRERARFEMSRIHSSQPMPRNGASASSLASTSLGAVQGIVRGAPVARGNPASANPVYMAQTAYTSPREYLLIRLRALDDRLGKLPTRDACEAAHLTD
ncbi:MAG: hypothetical protein HOQ11_05945 [Gemmatimonadaceae bacterium]|nr:hypothetical protein [Gemmatimonadaceae bacterium]NUQ92008.1 hypothetical protein [Gemmatimonadaceae bacterium]NUR19148.1 hypothetical protein [Gemmatimonadaceae bacterium]NUS96929.1 hypothetical protein [Gemmatimonadaceae bacterium]